MAKIAVIIVRLVEEAEDVTNASLAHDIRLELDASPKIPWMDRVMNILVGDV